MSLAARVADVELQHPLMNGAGTCKTLEDVERLAPSSISAVVVGSVTAEPRLGNDGQVYWTDGTSSLNSLGLPNRGAVYYREHLRAMVATAHAAAKPLVLSVAGFSPEEHAELAGLGRDAGADLVELNLACPNVWEEGRQKRIASFDPGAVRAILTRVDARVRGAPVVGVKLSPFSDPHALQSVAEVIAGFRCVGFATTSANFPNALALDSAGRPVIGAGYAGLGGPALKPIGLGQVRQLRELLPGRIDVVGAGGIAAGADIRDYLRAGAAAVQAATRYWSAGESPRAFTDVLEDYVGLATGE